MAKKGDDPSGQSWSTFLRNHMPHIAAIDLFVVPTIGFRLLYALVIVRLARRELVWINVTAHPTADWIAQQIAEAFPWDEAPRYLIRDRDAVYGSVVTRRLRAMGIRDKPISAGSPWQNGFAERLISKLGISWVEYWNKLLYQGLRPHKLKEMCRIKISVAHQCGYCSTVRSNIAKVEGLTEDIVSDLSDYANSNRFTEREKAALHYAEMFKRGEHSIDRDEVYADLAKHFSDEEIIELGLFCAEVDGVGKFVKSLNVLSWEEACKLDPRLKSGAPLVAAE